MATTAPCYAKGTTIRLKPATRRHLEAIQRERRWKFNEAIAIAVEQLAKREGIKLPEPSAA